MSNNSKMFQPTPGFIIAKPYLDENATFKSEKETAGDLQRSVVIAVGESYVDDSANLRQAPVKKGDVILHRYTSNSGTIDYQEIRSIHFSEVISLLNIK